MSSSLERELFVTSHFDVGVNDSLVIGLDGVRNGLPSLFVTLLLLTVSGWAEREVLIDSQDSGISDSLVIGFEEERNGLSSSII